MFNKAIRIAACLVAAAAMTIPALATDRYAAGFEQPTFQLGTLAGETYWNGQDGWVATGDGYDEPDFASIVVQDDITRDGQQAAMFSAVGQESGFINTWRNLAFDPLDDGEPYVYVDLDFYIADNADRSEVWGMGIQSGPMTGLTKWLIWDDNRITILDPSSGDWLDTGHQATRNAWHHMQTIIDFTSMTVRLNFDGQQIAMVGTWDSLQLYAFASIYLGTPGSDTLYFDNYSVRSLVTTGIDDRPGALPTSITLDQNYPNPFNAETAIDFNLPTDSNIRLEIYDVLGRKVETLAEGRYAAGSHKARWSADSYPSGTYFYVLTSNEATISKRMTLIK